MLVYRYHTTLWPRDRIWRLLPTQHLTEIELRGGRSSVSPDKTRSLGSDPDLHVGSFAHPLLPRFGGCELWHFFSIQLQNTWVLMPHHLRGGNTLCQQLSFSNCWLLTCPHLQNLTTNNQMLFICYWFLLPFFGFDISHWVFSSPVWEEKTQHLWTPSRKREKGAAAPP